MLYSIFSYSIAFLQEELAMKIGAQPRRIEIRLLSEMFHIFVERIDLVEYFSWCCFSAISCASSTVLMSLVNTLKYKTPYSVIQNETRLMVPLAHRFSIRLSNDMNHNALFLHHMPACLSSH